MYARRTLVFLAAFSLLTAKPSPKRVAADKKLDANFKLMCAVSEGKLAAAEKLLKIGADPNVKNRWGESALMGTNNIAMAKLLIAHGGDINYIDQVNGTPLMHAVDAPEYLKFLISRGANINGSPDDGDTALTAAVREEDLKLVRYLVSKGARVRGVNALHWAVDRNNLPIARYLLSKGATANEREKTNYSMLTSAASSGKTEMVRLLIKHGAKVKRRPDVVQPVAAAGSLAVLKLLLKHGASINDVSEGSPAYASILANFAGKPELKQVEALLKRSGFKDPDAGFKKVAAAVRAGDLQTLKRLSKGRDLARFKNKYGHDLLDILLQRRKRSYAITEYLIAKGLKPTGANVVATMYPHYDFKTLDLFLKNGASINAIDGGGGHISAEVVLRERLAFEHKPERLLKALERIKALGARFDVIDNQGESALSHAAELKGDFFVKWLLQNGAKVHDRALLGAIQRRNFAAGKALVAAGVNVNAKAINKSAFERAGFNGAYGIAELLVDNGAKITRQQAARFMVPHYIDVKPMSPRLAKKILKYKPDLNHRDEHKQDALMWAAHQGQYELAKLLIENGADVLARDHYGNTALSRSIAGGHTRLVKLLLEAGARLDMVNYECKPLIDNVRQGYKEAESEKSRKTMQPVWRVLQPYMR